MKYQFEDFTVRIIAEGSCFAVRLEDNNCDELDSAINIIRGFPSEAEAKSFVLMGDFHERDNDFILITKPKYKIKWDAN